MSNFNIYFIFYHIFNLSNIFIYIKIKKYVQSIFCHLTSAFGNFIFAIILKI